MKHFVVLIPMLFFLSIQAAFTQNKEVYDALASKKLENIDQQLKVLNGNNSTAHQAYKGTLLMTKAGLVKGPAKKLKFFKEGRNLLENAIQQDNDNGEYRFLRLMIQENAPDILGYNKEIKDDAAIVQKSYASLPKEVQNAIRDYSAESKSLKSITVQ